MLKTLLVILLSMLMAVSIVTPSALLLSDIRMELSSFEDNSEEETKNNAKEIFEKEIVLHASQKQEWLFARSKGVLNGSDQTSVVTYPSDIFLPPPERRF